MPSQFTDDQALAVEHRSYVMVKNSISIVYYLAAVVVFFYGVTEFANSPRVTSLGVMKAVVWIAAMRHFYVVLNWQRGIFGHLEQWHQSLLRRKSDFDALQAVRAGETLYKVCSDGRARQLQEVDGALVVVPDSKSSKYLSD